MTGGSHREDLVGAGQLLLIILLYMNPNVFANKLYTYIVANGGKLYTRVQILQQCAELNVSRKRLPGGSYKSFSTDSIRKMEWLVTLLPSVGGHHLDIILFFDIDETGVYLKGISGMKVWSYTS